MEKHHSKHTEAQESGSKESNSKSTHSHSKWKKWKRRMKRKWKRYSNLVIAGVMLAAFIAVFVRVFQWEASLEDMPAPTESVPIATEPTEPAFSVPPISQDPSYEPRKINFLLIGTDWHQEGENGRSDSMILCSVDTGAKTVVMTSFLRDIYLKIPDNGHNRLNAAYSWGGSELLNDTLELNFGVRADVNIEIDFDGFSGLIEELGGVDIELTEKEADYLYYTNGWDFAPGVNHLDGKQALTYSRIRYLDSDFGRTQRQRNVLLALMENFRGASLKEMLEAADIFLKHSTSDHSDRDLLGLALEMHNMMDDFEVITHRVPADGTYSYETVRGMSVIEVDFDENRELLKELLK